MLFSKLFGRSKDAPAPQEHPRSSGSTQSGPAVAPAPARPISAEQREHYNYLSAGLRRFGQAAISSAPLCDLISAPLADMDSQLRRVVSHQDFETALNELYDRNEESAGRHEVFESFLAARKEFGSQGFISESLAAVIKNKDGTTDEYLDRIWNHPDFKVALDRYDSAADRQAGSEADHPFLTYIQGIDEQAFADPNTMLSFTDTRPQNWEGTRYKHLVHYQRIAGTMSEREKFVYLMAHAMQYFLPKTHGTDTTYNEYAMRMSAALYGSGKGEQQWEVDAAYSGEKTEMFLSAAKTRFDPWPVDKFFNMDAKTVLDLHEESPDEPLAQWGIAKLRPHSAGWATSR